MKEPIIHAQLNIYSNGGIMAIGSIGGAPLVFGTEYFIGACHDKRPIE